MRRRPAVLAVAVAYACALFGWLGADEDARLSTAEEVGFVAVIFSSVVAGAVLRRGFGALALVVLVALALYAALREGAVSNEVWVVDLLAKAVITGVLFYLGSWVAGRRRGAVE